MNKVVSLNTFNKSEKVFLLKELGFKTDGEFIFYENDKKVVDKYLNIPVRFENMMILPGNTIILDDNEYSLSMYMEEYREF